MDALFVPLNIKEPFKGNNIGLVDSLMLAQAPHV